MRKTHGRYVCACEGWGVCVCVCGVGEIGRKEKGS